MTLALIFFTSCLRKSLCASLLLGRLMVTQQRTEAVEFISETVRSVSVPQGCGINGNDRLPEPTFRLCSQTDHRQVRSTLHDCIDIRSIQLFQHRAEFRRSD